MFPIQSFGEVQPDVPAQNTLGAEEGGRLVYRRTLSSLIGFPNPDDLAEPNAIYEWQTTPTGKQSFRFTLKAGGFFCMAGLWGGEMDPPATRR